MFDGRSFACLTDRYSGCDLNRHCVCNICFALDLDCFGGVFLCAADFWIGFERCGRFELVLAPKCE